MKQINNSEWLQEIGDEFSKPYMISLQDKLAEERNSFTIYPKENLVFNAFELTPYSKVRVIILGQDPYHGEQQAHGLSFSVAKGIKPPPSLVNTFKEIRADIGIENFYHGDLSSWANQGVLLLNTCLTVRKGMAASHKNLGWEQFTDAVIQKLSANKTGLIFMLWGNFAQSKKALIDSQKHIILEAAHPSPFSAYKGFFGCRHFSKANYYLEKKYGEIIDWSIPF